jgi:hypothetical protein
MTERCVCCGAGRCDRDRALPNVSKWVQGTNVGPGGSGHNRVGPAQARSGPDTPPPPAASPPRLTASPWSLGFGGYVFHRVRGSGVKG